MTFTNSYHIYLFRSTPIIIYGGDLQGFIWELIEHLPSYIYKHIYLYIHFFKLNTNTYNIKILEREDIFPIPSPVFGRPPAPDPTDRIEDSMTLEVDSPRQVGLDFLWPQSRGAWCRVVTPNGGKPIGSEWWQLKYFLCSPRKLGNISNLTIIFFKGVETLKPPTRDPWDWYIYLHLGI